ncbi:MAG: squalene/phytoene synthase family protein [Gemmataceae bacterium]
MNELGKSYSWCERVARRAAKNFYPAFRLLPLTQRRSMCALYTFLRVADDLADSAEPLEQRQASLQQLRTDLIRALQGQSPHLLFPALCDTLTRYRIPPRLLEEALDGVEQDLSKCCYATYAELSHYCYLVAGTVGLCCLHIWGYHGEAGREAAEAAGRALQLTNILRDVGEDARRGRIYLPADEMARFGVTAESIRREDCDERFRSLMRFQAQRAYEQYHAAHALIRWLPAPGRAVFQVLTETYRALLDEIVRRNYDVFRSRVRLPRWFKMWLAVRALPVRFSLWA